MGEGKEAFSPVREIFKCCSVNAGEAAEAWSSTSSICSAHSAAIDQGPKRQGGCGGSRACSWQDQTHGQASGTSLLVLHLIAYPPGCFVCGVAQQRPHFQDKGLVIAGAMLLFFATA